MLHVPTYVYPFALAVVPAVTGRVLSGRVRDDPGSLGAPDIAGTASKSGADKGARGRPVALLAHFLAGRAEKNCSQ
jgi:hypothetical protein